MKRIIGAILLCAGVVSAQVLTDAATIKNDKFAVQAAPVYYPKNLTAFFSAAYGINKNSDIKITAGFPNNGTYFGISNKWLLAKSYGPEFSISYGAHKRGSAFGADGTMTLGFKISMTSRLYVGIDGDMDFHSNNTTTNPAWAFIGITDDISQFVEYHIEAQPAVNSAAWNIFSAGVRIILN